MKKIVKILTFTLFAVFISHNVAAQDAEEDEERMRVIMEISPSSPAINASFTIGIYADYNAPDEITVLPPTLPSSLTFERFTKSPKIINEQTWTYAEYRFSSKEAGDFFLDSFTVVSPYGVNETEPVNLIIQSNNTGKIITPRVTWEETPSQMKTGEKALIKLRIQGWNSVTPGGEFFMYDAGENFIMDIAPNTERSEGVAVKFLLVPLEAKNIILRAKTLQYENTRFEIPSLRINVVKAETPDRKETAEISASDVQTGGFPAFEIPADKHFFSRGKYRAQTEEIYNKALNLWNEKLYARSLAEMRRFERDSAAGKNLRAIRREAEESLGLTGMLNENNAKYRIYLTLIIIFLFFVIILPLGCFIILKGSIRKKSAVFCVVLCLCAELFFISRLRDDKPPSEDRYKSGVSLGVKLRRIADIEAEELLYLREGYPVIIMQKSGSWLYVRANNSDSTAGWIPDENIIKY